MPLAVSKSPPISDLWHGCNSALFKVFHCIISRYHLHNVAQHRQTACDRKTWKRRKFLRCCWEREYSRQCGLLRFAPRIILRNLHPSLFGCQHDCILRSRRETWVQHDCRTHHACNGNRCLFHNFRFRYNIIFPNAWFEIPRRPREWPWWYLDCYRSLRNFLLRVIQYYCRTIRDP